MALIKLNLVVPSIEDVIGFFDRIKVYRSTTGITGVYTEVTTAGDRPTLEPGVSVYSYFDTAGAETYYYKSSFYNSVSTDESSQSAPALGEGSAALDVLSVDELKTIWLYGLDLTDDSGEPFPDTMYEHYIKYAVAWVEHRLDLKLAADVIEGEKHHFYREDYAQFMFFQTKESPVISVEEIRLVLPGNTIAQTFPADWIHLDTDAGQIQILPGQGSIGTTLLGSSGAWMPWLAGMQRFIPDAFRIDYTAGLSPVPHDLKEAVGMLACFGPLSTAGDLIAGAGIANVSLSIDGLSQSIGTTSSATNSGFGARTLSYTRALKDLIPALEGYYKGPKLMIM